MLRPGISYPLIAFVTLVAGALAGCPPPGAPAGTAGALAAQPSAPSGGARFVQKLEGGFLLVEVCADDLIRIAYAKDTAFFARATLMTAPKRCKPSAVRTTEEGSVKTLTTAKVKVRIDLATGAVSFRDLDDRLLVAEKTGGRTLTPATVQGESTFHVRQEWDPVEDEALYGLGQHQQDLLNIKDVDLDLRQYNTEIFIPFLVSSRGYGLLWDNTSFSRFGDLASAIPLPDTTGLYSKDGQPGDVAVSGPTVDWSGNLVAPASGDYLFRTYSTGEIKLWVDQKLVVDHWRQDWLPGEDIARVRLAAGRTVPIRLHFAKDHRSEILRLLFKPPVPHRTTSLWSEVGDGIDYTFVYGPDLDRVIAGYRQLTGQAPMMPKWAFGLWQCRERYKTQEESLEVVDGFRTRHIPFDNIVQDWQYWKPGDWGSHQFDSSRFPDPDRWIAELHRKNARLMISVWPKFYRGTANFEALEKQGYLYGANLKENQKDFLGQVFTYYDAFSAAARKLYWSQIREALFARGADAWWMDATEPEVVNGPFPSVAAWVEAIESHMHPTAAGTGARMLNAFALVNSQAIYEGQRDAAPQQRVFILTRNGFAGQQRYAAASWSGDISSTWTAMRKQIPAGLGFSISGVPYWTLDSGGFSVPQAFSSSDASPAEVGEWRELNTRWFEYATFLPLLRVHGQWPKREMWEFGGDDSPAFRAQLKFDRLRYRLLPYIYSLAGAVTQDGGTIMRPLVMDFRTDLLARDVSDQFMFGPAIMVSPVTSYLARSRPVVLPETPGGWYDFFTGAALAPGTIKAPAPFDAIPLHVRAGSLVPIGPELQYTGEKPADPITLYIYAGADGSFVLYEDAGLDNTYEKGSFTRIPMRWNDAQKTLAIGAREGSFSGMLLRRRFQLILITPAHPVPFSFDATGDKTVEYTGVAMDVKL